MLSALVLGVSGTGIGGEAQVSECTTIDSPGTYVLDTPVTTATSGTCFVITASDVVLDGQDHTVTLTGSGDAVNVTSSGDVTNVTVRNLRVDGGSDGFVVHAPGDGATVDVAVTDNAVTNTTNDGVTVRTAGLDSTVDVAIADNTLNTGGHGVGVVAVDGDRSVVNVSIRDNAITSDDRGIHNVDANDDEQTVEVEIARNDIDAGDEGIYGIELYGDDSSHDVAILDNTIASGAGDEGIQFIEAGGGTNQTLAFDVSDNSIDAGDHGIGNVNVGGSSTTASVTVRANDITAEADGVTGLIVESDAQTATFDVSHNDVSATDDGIRIEPGPALGTSSGGLVAESNDLHVGGSAVVVEDGPLEGIELHDNTLAGDEYGVENLNTTEGVYVDATNNYWDAGDGPASAGPYEDPVTGALANGTGSNVTNSTGTSSNVHFDPYLQPGSESANVAVTVDSTNSPVTEGETLSVFATVENTGEAAATQTVTLSTDGSQRDATSVTLDGGESTSLELTWDTEEGDAGEHTVTVASADDAAATSVTVERRVSVTPPPASFSVAIDATDSPVREGDPLNVTATVDNAGGRSDTQTVTLSLNGTERDATSVTLKSGESTTVTFTWDTAEGDAGEYTATVASDHDADSTQVTVDAAPASVEISDQVVQASGTLVVVDTVNLPDGGFVAIHNASLTDGDETGSLLGISSYLSAGEHDNVQIRLDRGATGSRTVYARPNNDTDDDFAFDFVASGGQADEPYRDGGKAVRDSASVSVATPTLSPTATETRTPTASRTPTEATPTATSPLTTDPTDGGGAGFGPVVAVLALVGGILLALRRRP